MNRKILGWMESEVIKERSELRTDATLRTDAQKKVVSYSLYCRRAVIASHLFFSKFVILVVLVVFVSVVVVVVGGGGEVVVWWR